MTNDCIPLEKKQHLGRMGFLTLLLGMLWPMATLWGQGDAVRNDGRREFSVMFLPTQSQLPMASVHCILQDSEGYLWYGTEGGGLCRDNGYQIDVFRPKESRDLHEACQVHCLVETAGGDILFGTSDGVFRVDKHDYAVRPVELDTAAKFIDNLFTDAAGQTWVGSHGRLYCCEADGTLQATYSCRIGEKEADVASFYEDSRKTLYVLQWKAGIMRKQRGEKRFSPLRWPLPSTPIQMIEDQQHGCFWVLTSGAGIQRMEIVGDECRLTPQPATLGSESRNCGLNFIRDSRYGLFWVTTLDNLYTYSIGADGQLHEYPLTGLLPEGNKILDQIRESRDGSIYVSGYTPHTFVISSAQSDITRQSVEAIRRYTGFPVLADRAVYDDNRYIWIWQGRQGLMLYDREADHVEPSPRKASRTLQRSTQGGIWASNGNAIFRLWQSGGTMLQEDIIELPEKEDVRCLAEALGKHLLIATRSHLYRLSLISRQLQETASLPAAPSDIGIDRQGSVFLSLGTEGLCSVADGQVSRLDQTRENFLSLSVAPDGSVWTSTYEGHVYRWLPSEHRLVCEERLSSRNGVPIKTIRTDGLGHVWTLTDQMVCEYAPQSRAYRVICNTDPFVDVSYFYTLEPIAPTRMGIDGAGALLEVESSPELSQQRAANVRITVSSISINGETRLIGRDARELRLAADEQDFALQLSTLDHLHVPAVCFAYQLEGVNRDWVYLPQGTNTIILTNLEKGRHRLRVMATDRYGCWSEAAVVLTLRRAPHWYQTWWAYLLYIAIAFVLCYGIWRLESRISLLNRLIRRRREVRLDEIELKREDIAAVRRDDDQLRLAIAKVEENLSRADYNVTALSNDMCMSRITLYRRIQELTGQSPTDFIRDIRLKKAAQLLLQNPDATLSDIARKVGFSTPKYFSKCFKDKFGVLPREYVEQPQNED